MCASAAPQYPYYTYPVVFSHAYPIAAAPAPSVPAVAAVRAAPEPAVAASAGGHQAPEVVIQWQVDSADRLEYFNNLLK